MSELETELLLGGEFIERARAEMEISYTVFVFAAIFVTGAAFIFFLFLLLIVKRPPPSREASAAITLTIAAVVLLSGLWSLWLSPTYETTKYDEIASNSLSIEPLDSFTQTFEAQKGQEIEIQINAPSLPREEPPVFPLFSVRIYDTKGKLIWTQTNVTKGYFAYMTLVAETGTFKVEVGNPQKEAISLTLRVIDRTRTTVRPLEPVGQWLTIVSMPIIGLGAWFARSKRQNQQPLQI